MWDEVRPFFLTVNSESLGRDLDLAPLYPQSAEGLTDYVFNPFAEPKLVLIWVNAILFPIIQS